MLTPVLFGSALAIAGLVLSLTSCGTDAPSGVGGASASSTGTVVSITDGDTLRLDLNGEELAVRLTGIDTPEVYPEVECFGPEAEALLAELAPVGARLRVEYDRDPRDPFGRELLYLYTQDGTFVNLELVARGAAEAVLFEPNDRYWDELRAAERAAQDARLGLWAQC
ncbi:MAG: thermonuclease family protein [Microcella sp.]|uniref:thermonuclease family protein n=1 Tax=Microcella sp. TaxID=1913979 RepID=UPI003314A99C